MRLETALKKFFKPFHHDPIFPPFNEAIRYRPYRLKNELLFALAGFFPVLLRRFFDWGVTERIVEIPFVFRNLRAPATGKVLDFGCSDSRICMHLANLGYQVVGLDFLPYRFSHPNLQVRTGDFFEMEFAEETFDAIIAVSAVEHVGLDVYGRSKSGERGDYLVLERFAKLLKPNGQLILTVPFGRPQTKQKLRIYDWTQLGPLLSNFQIETRQFYVCRGGKYWSEESVQNAERQKNESKEVDGVALISCFKKNPRYPEGSKLQ